MNFEKPSKSTEKSPNLKRRTFLGNALTAGAVAASGLLLGKYIAGTVNESQNGDAHENKKGLESNTSKDRGFENSILSMDGIILKVEKDKTPKMTALPGFFGGTSMLVPHEIYLIYITNGSKEIKVSVDQDSFNKYGIGDHIHVEYEVRQGNPYRKDHLRALSIRKADQK